MEELERKIDLLCSNKVQNDFPIPPHDYYDDPSRPDYFRNFITGTDSGNYPKYPDATKVNKYIREPDSIRSDDSHIPHIHNTINAVENEFKYANTSHKGGLVHRVLFGVNHNTYEPKKTYIHKSYMHTSSRPDIHKVLSNMVYEQGDTKPSHLLHLKVPPKHLVLNVVRVGLGEDEDENDFDVDHAAPHEQERLFPRGTRFKVHKVEHKNGVSHVHGEILPYKGAPELPEGVKIKKLKRMKRPFSW